MQEENERLKADRAALLAVARAARTFNEKLKSLQSAINGAFFFQHMHGIPYEGETYEVEQDALDATLADPTVQEALR